MNWNNIKGHLSTINAHKRLVTWLCFRCGLYKQGLLHDLSKYSPQELKTGFTYWQGNRSPIDAQKEAEGGLSRSWLHHKGRNPHHWEYWLDFDKNGIFPQPMDRKYVAEMFCDRVAASMVYQKDKYTDRSALDYYLQGKGHMVLHEKTDRELRFLLEYLSEYGLDRTLEYIRKVYLLNRD